MVEASIATVDAVPAISPGWPSGADRPVCSVFAGRACRPVHAVRPGHASRSSYSRSPRGSGRPSGATGTRYARVSGNALGSVRAVDASGAFRTGDRSGYDLAGFRACCRVPLGDVSRGARGIKLGGQAVRGAGRLGARGLGHRELGSGALLATRLERAYRHDQDDQDHQRGNRPARDGGVVRADHVAAPGTVAGEVLAWGQSRPHRADPAAEGAEAV